ncbi:MAG TPA: FecR family protein [Cyclobacteriaceae bacterium]|nr:FecR family protein [Cyclobacteriaceae bacterium]
MKLLSQFKTLLGRFLSGSTTPEENEVIEKWYSALDSYNNHPLLDSKEADALHITDFETIQNRIKNRGGKVIYLWASLAAAAVIIFGIVYVYFIDGSAISNANAGANAARIVVHPRGKFSNDTQYAKAIWLIDSSRIVLQPKSFITVAESFNEVDRNIVLEGEALFEIKRDEKRPFHAFTYGVVTKVLGTSFVIKAPSRDKEITVIVRTGKVSVASEETGDQKSNREVIVTPNQQATFYPEKKLLEASVVEEPMLLLKVGKFRTEYDEEPIVNILDEIEKMYGVEISYDREALKKCKITTAFAKEGLYERLNILTKVIGAKYTVEGVRIYVYSKGCQIN